MPPKNEMQESEVRRMHDRVNNECSQHDVRRASNRMGCWAGTSFALLAKGTVCGVSHVIFTVTGSAFHSHDNCRCGGHRVRVVQSENAMVRVAPNSVEATRAQMARNRPKDALNLPKTPRKHRILIGNEMHSHVLLSLIQSNVIHFS